MNEYMPQGKETVSDQDIIEALRKLEGGFGATIEIADEFGMSRQWAHQRLMRLYNQGRIHRKQPSPQNVIYWPPSD